GSPPNSPSRREEATIAAHSPGSSKLPSGFASTATTRSRLHGSGKRSQIRRQHAQASSRNLLSLALPPARRACNITPGRGQESHPPSVTASPLLEQEVQTPAAKNVNPWPPTVGQHLLVRAAPLLQGIAQHRHRLKVPGVVDATGQGEDGGGQPGGVQGC